MHGTDSPRPLHCEIAAPRSPAGPRAPLLLMIHGLGADEHDLLPLADLLDPRCLVAGVRAPFPYAYGGYAWYDLGAVGRPDPVRFPQSYGRLLATVDELRARPDVDPGRVILFGFSMGAVMSLALALTRPELFRAVSANSGYLPEVAALPFRPEAAGHLDILVAHGTADPLVPVALGRAARDYLMTTNARVLYREYPMAHGIAPGSLADIGAWLTALLDRPLPPAA